MSKSIQIRDVPDEVHEVLAARAAKVGQSLSRYLLTELKHIAALPLMEETLDRPPRGRSSLTTEEVVRLIREDRDSR